MKTTMMDEMVLDLMAAQDSDRRENRPASYRGIAHRHGNGAEMFSEVCPACEAQCQDSYEDSFECPDCRHGGAHDSAGNMDPGYVCDVCERNQEVEDAAELAEHGGQ